MKLKIIKLSSGNTVTKELSPRQAMDMMNKLGKGYEAIPIEDEQKELSSELRPMDDLEISGIKNLHRIVSLFNDHKKFADNMYAQLQTNDLKISDKQAAYLWYLVYRYRKNIADSKIVEIAEERKVY